jgi:hypothetical protein
LQFENSKTSNQELLLSSLKTNWINQQQAPANENQRLEKTDVLVLKSPVLEARFQLYQKENISIRETSASIFFCLVHCINPTQNCYRR